MQQKPSEFYASQREEIMQRNPFREQVFGLIPPGTQRILDFGCHEGELLFRLARDKQCGQLYGIDIDPTLTVPLAEMLDGFWNINLAAPDADLAKDYVGFFRYIIMHDVVEHLYDPWYVCAKLRRYLAVDGRLIVVTPNLQSWQIVLQLVSGRFPYGAKGGIMNEDHLRWFTLQGLQEMLALSGYEAEQLQLLFPPGTDPAEQNLSSEERSVILPPLSARKPDMVTLQVQFPDAQQAQRNFQLFLANKLLAVCRRGTRAVEPEPLRPGILSQRRALYCRQMRPEGTSHGGND